MLVSSCGFGFLLQAQSGLSAQFLSAFIGAAIALALKAGYDEIKERQHRGALRKALECNINEILIPKLTRLIRDYDTVLKVINSPERKQLEENQKLQTDWIPMFNNDLIKRLQPNDVYKCLTDKTKFADLFDAYYTIDWLRAHMPGTLMQSFWKQAQEHFVKHMQNNNEWDQSDFIDHLFTCGTIQEIRRRITGEAQSRLSTAKELLQQLGQLKVL